MKDLKTILLVLLLTLFSCGQYHDDNDLNDPLAVKKSQIIVGTLDWVDVTEFGNGSSIRSNSLKVGDVIIPVMGSRCTGFLIAEDVVMTNHHCIPSRRYAENVKVRFKHERGVLERDMAEFVCDEFIGNDSSLDYALLRCKGNPSSTIASVLLATTVPSVGDELYVIQQNCDYYTTRGCDYTKKVSMGDVVNVGREITHNADTLGGSSGSPVFSKVSNMVIGLHHAGFGNNGYGRGYENYAVKMSEIVNDLRIKFPEINISTGGDSIGCGPRESRCQVGQIPYKNSDLKITEEEVDEFTLPAISQNGEIKIEFNHSRGDLDMKLFNSSMELIGSSDSTSNYEVIDFEAIEAGSVLKVYGYRGSVNSYKISITVKNNIVNKHNSFEMALPISLPFVAKEFSLDKTGESAYFKILLMEEGNINFQIEFDHSRGDLDLYLYNKNRVELKHSSGVTDSEEIITALAAGEYYLEVRGYMGAVGDYILK